MVLDALMLKCFTAVIRTRHQVFATHRPVVSGNIFIGGLKLTTVVTAEGSLWALLILVGLDVRTLKQLRAVKALNLCELASM